MAPHWTQQVAKCLLTGRPSQVIEAHLDALLLWLSNPESPRAAELDRAIGRQHLSRRQAVHRAYAMLDGLLFSEDGQPTSATLGLPPETDAQRAKQRYRRLVQVYHPDHHPDRAAWATQRTDQLNRAFDAYRKGTSSRRPRVAPKKSRTRARRQGPPTAWTVALDTLSRIGLRIRPPGWERATAFLDRLSGRAQLALAAAGAALAVALLIGLVQLGDTPKPVPKIIHHPLGTPPSATVPDVEKGRQGAGPGSTGESSGPKEQDRSEAKRAAAVEEAPVSRPEPPAVNDRETAQATLPVAEPTAPQETVDTTRPQPVPTEAPEPAQMTEHTPTSPAEPAPPPATAPQAAEASRPETNPRVDNASPQPAEPPPSRPEATPASPPPMPPRVGEHPPRIAPQEPQLEIPPIAPPTPPAAPVAPDLPLQLGSAVVETPAPPAVARGARDCSRVPKFLERFQRSYERGALDRLMALYSPLAKENDLATWFAIRQTYADWFDTTSARRITFERLRIEPREDGNRCAAMALFQVSYLDRQSLLVTKAGVIQILLEREGDGLRILRMRY